MGGGVGAPPHVKPIADALQAGIGFTCIRTPTRRRARESTPSSPRPCRYTGVLPVATPERRPTCRRSAAHGRARPRRRAPRRPSVPPIGVHKPGVGFPTPGLCTPIGGGPCSGRLRDHDRSFGPPGGEDRPVAVERDLPLERRRGGPRLTPPGNRVRQCATRVPAPCVVGAPRCPDHARVEPVHRARIAPTSVAMTATAPNAAPSGWLHDGWRWTT